MEAIFYKLLSMGITATYIVLFVSLTRIFIKRLPTRFSYYLWSIVFVRLALPFSFKGLYSLIPSYNQTITAISKVNSGLPIGTPQGTTSPLNTMVNIAYKPIEKSMDFSILPIIWMLGVLLILCYILISSYRLKTTLSTAVHDRDNIYYSDNISTPFIYGIVKPRIYLPTLLTRDEEEYILLHERYHIKRLDYIAKPVAFIISSLHWYNPMVWIAYGLMSRDMELSCDERVIELMGSGIKKAYSTSLLTLSSSGKSRALSPLAFGENSVKDRIKNVLGYKKPSRVAIIVSILIVLLVSIGLLSDGGMGKNAMGRNIQNPVTVEEYAEEFLTKESTILEDSWKQFDTDIKVIEKHITRLELLQSFSKDYRLPTEIWRLEYRIKPDNIDALILPGGMNQIDGLITEESSMGRPYLVFFRNIDRVEMLGMFWASEDEIDTLAKIELRTRAFMESIDEYKPSSDANHVIAMFKLSSGDSAKLLLSQPSTKGQGGIWVVEKWIDTYGNIYLNTPDTKLSLDEYYNGLQTKAEQGLDSTSLNPLDVAYRYVADDLGQIVGQSDITFKYDASLEEFNTPPESNYMGYISNLSNDKDYFYLDVIEWLTESDKDRLAQLNIDADSLTNGFYIYNPTSYPAHFELTKDTSFAIFEVDDSGVRVSYIPKEVFIEHINNQPPNVIPYRIKTKNGYVVSIEEQYMP